MLQTPGLVGDKIARRPDPHIRVMEFGRRRGALLARRVGRLDVGHPVRLKELSCAGGRI